MKSIDLNCDMGESFGAWEMGNDAELMNYVSSINIACGFHAGDSTTIRKTIELALKKGIAIGAHPSFPDLQGFGRRSMSLTPSEIFDVVLYQVAAVKGICEALGTFLRHVKPHGALYNQAARDIDTSKAICSAVKKIDRDLILYGLSGSVLISEAEKSGLRCANEVFADRTYQSDGNLTPRSEANALIENTEDSISQVRKFVSEQKVTTTSGNEASVKAETICIHGDGENAVVFAKAIHHELRENGIRIEQVKISER